MGAIRAGVLSLLGWSTLAVIGVNGVALAAPTWTAVTSPAPGFLDTCQLLTDGTVMCHEWNTNHWHRLSPNNTGSYVAGTWDSPAIADMPNGNDASFGCAGCTYQPLYYASAVLPDGRVIVIGGEDINLSNVETNIGFLYDPTTNSWSTQLTEAFGGGNVGDSMGIVLQDGTFVLSNIRNTNMEAFDGVLTFTALNPTGKLDRNNEEGWHILPNGTLLTVDTAIASSFEIYNPTTNTWGNSGATPVNMADTIANSQEIGPGLLRPDGVLVYFSGNSLGQNARYDVATGTWTHTASMDFPADPVSGLNFSVKDGPAAVLPNGNILVMASPVNNTKGAFLGPSHFYEVDFATNNLAAVVDSANAASFASFEGRMLLLPTGEVLLTAFNQRSDNQFPAHTVAPVQDVQIYSNGGAPKNAWRPVITSLPAHLAPGTTYTLSGNQLNGFDEGAAYGDDSQSATNYPLVRITSPSGHITYARTHGFSRMGVESVGSTEVITTGLDVPAGLELGASSLVVVANGIPSAPVAINVAPNHPPVARCKNFTTSANAMCLGSFVEANVDNGSSDPDGNPINCHVSPSGPFGPGANSVTVVCTDPSGGSDFCSATVTVVDTTPSVLTVPADRTVATCTDSAVVSVGQATATDNCAMSLVPTGQVISKNGVPLNPPINVVGGQVTLGIGTFVIRWTVSDGANPPVTRNQTVVVGTKIEAGQSFVLDDRAQLQNGAGGFAAMLNAGSGTTQVGNDGRSGAILSVGPVRVLHRAAVAGSATSASTVFKESDGTISGSITQGATVVLPPLPTLPSFPTPTLGGFTVNSATTQTRGPGSYTNATVINGGTLILAAGDYFFQNLTINAGSTVRVTPTTRVFVQSSLIFNAPFLASAGTAVQPTFLGFAGSNLSLTAQFNGTLVAPAASVVFGTGPGVVYTGSFFGRSLEVTPASSLVCSLNTP